MSGFLKKIILMTGPGTALQELLYAIIMALIFVYAARFGILEFENVTDFVLVEFGMIATWGVIDGVIFYYIGVCDQRRYCRMISNQTGLEYEERVKSLMDDFDSTPLDVLTDEKKRAICEEILDSQLESKESMREDRRTLAMSSLGCVIVSLLGLLPIVIPVLLMNDFQNALVVSSFLSSAVLFIVGFMMSSFLGTNKWLTGFSLLFLSLAISIISVFTGG